MTAEIRVRKNIGIKTQYLSLPRTLRGMPGCRRHLIEATRGLARGQS